MAIHLRLQIGPYNWDCKYDHTSNIQNVSGCCSAEGPRSSDGAVHYQYGPPATTLQRHVDRGTTQRLQSQDQIRTHLQYTITYWFSYPRSSPAVDHLWKGAYSNWMGSWCGFSREWRQPRGYEPLRQNAQTKKIIAVQTIAVYTLSFSFRPTPFLSADRMGVFLSHPSSHR